MKKAMIGLMGLALLAPVLSHAQLQKHHVNKENGDMTQTSQYRNTPDYSGKHDWEIRKEQWLAKQPAKQNIGRENRSEMPTRAAQYQNTPSYRGGMPSWEVNQKNWRSAQPAKHHENRNK